MLLACAINEPVRGWTYDECTIRGFVHRPLQPRFCRGRGLPDQTKPAVRGDMKSHQVLRLVFRAERAAAVVSYHSSCRCPLRNSILPCFHPLSPARQPSFRLGPWRVLGTRGSIKTAAACLSMVCMVVWSFWPPLAPAMPPIMNYSIYLGYQGSFKFFSLVYSYPKEARYS
jgi:hypothetical protein